MRTTVAYYHGITPMKNAIEYRMQNSLEYRVTQIYEKTTGRLYKGISRQQCVQLCWCLILINVYTEQRTHPKPRYSVESAPLPKQQKSAFLIFNIRNMEVIKSNGEKIPPKLLRHYKLDLAFCHKHSIYFLLCLRLALKFFLSIFL